MYLKDKFYNNLSTDLNSEKNTNDYEFIIDDNKGATGARINLGFMKLIMLKELNFDKNELINDYQLSKLNRILHNTKQTEAQCCRLYDKRRTKQRICAVFNSQSNQRL